MKQKKKNNNSFSLLSQQEIDTLVDFLTDKKNSLESDVLSQSSIDKLITLIQTDRNHISLNSLLSFDNLDYEILKKLNFRQNETEDCELLFYIDDDTNYITLSIHNAITNEETTLYPSAFDGEDTEHWGYSIVPATFTNIASSLALKFSQETYDAICNLFAKTLYGDENHTIPKVYLPDNDVMTNCLL